MEETEGDESMMLFEDVLHAVGGGLFFWEKGQCRNGQYNKLIEKNGLLVY